jgi:hypothetical protein
MTYEKFGEFWATDKRFEKLKLTKGSWRHSPPATRTFASLTKTGTEKSREKSSTVSQMC